MEGLFFGIGLLFFIPAAFFLIIYICKRNDYINEEDDQQRSVKQNRANKFLVPGLIFAFIFAFFILCTFAAIKSRNDRIREQITKPVNPDVQQEYDNRMMSIRPIIDSIKVPMDSTEYAKILKDNYKIGSHKYVVENTTFEKDTLQQIHFKSCATATEKEFKDLVGYFEKVADRKRVSLNGELSNWSAKFDLSSCFVYIRTSIDEESNSPVININCKAVSIYVGESPSLDHIVYG